MKFQIGETVICSCEVKDDAGAYKDPITSMQIKINCTKPSNHSILAATAMTKDSTGKYHYDFASASNLAGTYEAVYTATDGSRITIEKDIFDLEE